MTNAQSADEDLKQKLLAETRTDLLKRQLSNAENYDKAIISLSTAFLGFSLLFMKDFISVNIAVGLWLVYGSWAMLTGAVLSTIISFLVSQSAINVQLERAEDYYLRGNQAALTRSQIAKAADWFNISSGVLFVLGVSIFTAFVFANFERSSIMSNSQKGNQPLNEGAPIPKMTSIEKSAPIPNLQPMSQPTQSPAPSTPAAPPPSSPSSDGGKK